MRRSSEHQNELNHWLDYSNCEEQVIEDTKRLIKIIKICLPLIIIYSLYFQAESRWLLQASKMDTLAYSYHIKPEQLKIIHVIMLLVIVPIHLQYTIPMLARRNMNFSLSKILFGAVLILIAYITSGVLQVFLEATNPPQPRPGCSQLLVVNSFNCPYSMHITHTKENLILNALTFYHNTHIEVRGTLDTQVILKKIEEDLPEHMCPTISPINMTLVEDTASLYAIMGSEEESYRLSARNERPKTGYPKVKILYKLKDMNSGYKIQFCSDTRCAIRGHLNNLKSYKDVYPGVYKIYINDQYMPVRDEVALRVGGLYLFTIVEDINSTPDSVKVTIGIHILVKPNSIHILWQIPQYVIYTFGELFFLLPEMEFLFDEAPATVKPIMIDYLFLSKSLANLIVAGSTQSSQQQSIDYLSFSIAAIVAVIVFGISIRNFPYVVKS